MPFATKAPVRSGDEPTASGSGGSDGGSGGAGASGGGDGGGTPGGSGGSGGSGASHAGGSGGGAGGGSGGDTGGTGGALDPRCNDACASFADGECDDGGPDAAYAVCSLGSDCADCGPRDSGTGGMGGTGGAGGAGGSGGVAPPVDPCADVLCPARAASCEAGNVHQDVADGTCDPETGACDYGLVAYIEFCVDAGLVCQEGACVDLCDPAPDCTAPPDACELHAVIHYTGAGSCASMTGECDFSQVTERTECEPGLICRGLRCVEPCAGVTCPPLAPRCEAQIAVTQVADGLCDPVDGECDYSAVTARDDCGARGLICERGECVADDIIVPRPGDLMLTELMHAPLGARPDLAAQWFELHNLSPRRLQLNEVRFVTDLGERTFPADAPPIVMAPDAYQVFGNDVDPLTNGGVSNVVFLPDYTFSPPTDYLRVYQGMATLENVYVDLFIFGGAPGASLQFDADLTAETDNNNAGAWCPSTSVYGNGDLGTPGAPNVSCGEREVLEVPIRALRDPADPLHPVEGTRVGVRNVVVTEVAGPRIWVREEDAGLYDGLLVYFPGRDFSFVQRGDHIDVQGVFDVFFGTEEIFGTRLEVIAAGNPPQPIDVDLAELMNPATAEPYENLLVRVLRPVVINENPDIPADFFEFSVGRGEAGEAGLRIDDLIHQVERPIPLDTTFESITGVLTFAFNNYHLQPRDADDVVGRLDPGSVPFEVDIRDFEPTPNPAVVLAGQSIRFTNRDRISHTVTSGTAGDPAAGQLFDSGPLRRGDTFETTPAAVGQVPYFCRVHPDNVNEWILSIGAPPAP